MLIVTVGSHHISITVELALEVITVIIEQPFFSPQVSILFSFFVPTGLGDHSEEVRVEMLNAALTAVNHLGKVKKCCSYVKYV